MTDQKPTGVFVRLPLSDEQRAKIVAGMIPPPISVSDAFEKVALNIGTPVTGGDLKPIGKVAGHFSDGQPMVRIINHPHLPYETEIALYSDAQAKIAALEAEVMRLHGSLVEIAESDDTDNALDPERNKRVARAALKDGAA